MTEKELTRNDKVKGYGIIIGLFTLAAQHAIYTLANFMAQLVGITPFLPKIACIDDAIPIIPIFIIPYVWAYATWAMAPMAVSKCSLKYFKNFMAAYLFACILGAIILTFAPTYMDRVEEGLYDQTNQGFFWSFLRFWYSLDGSERAFNLFPSFHCLNSTLAAVGVIGRKEISKPFRIYSVIIAILVFASTVFVKQHFVIDIFGGIAVALIAYFICIKVDAGRIFDPLERFFVKVNGKKETKE